MFSELCSIGITLVCKLEKGDLEGTCRREWVFKMQETMLSLAGERPECSPLPWRISQHPGPGFIPGESHVCF